MVLDIDVAGSPVDFQVFHGGGDFRIADGIFIRVGIAEQGIAAENKTGAAGKQNKDNNEGTGKQSGFIHLSHSPFYL